MNWKSFVCALACTSALSPSAAAGEPSAPISRPAYRAPVYTLRHCVDLAERNYPKVLEAQAQLESMRAQVWQAKTEPFSQFQVSGGVGLAPTLGGTSVYSKSSDVAITSNMALAWRIGVEGALPLYTFGKITNLIDAAKAQTKVGEHGVQKAKNEIRLSVRRAYYGAQLARDVAHLIGKARARIDKYLSSLERRVQEGDGDDIELLKLKMYRAELAAREAETEKERRIALAGLRFYTGIDGEFDVVDAPLRRMPHTLGPLARYLTAARLFRPEINMARAGVLARRAQVELERSKFYPDLALGVSAGWARAPEIADQINPFVRDEANYLRYGAGLVLRWKLDFLPQAARVAQATAKLEEVRATERFALGGVGAEVEQAFAEAKEAESRLEAYGDATRYARQWLIKVQQGIDIGTFDDEDIVDPAKEYALKRFSEMTALFDYNVALSKLAVATGWQEVAPLR